MAGFNMTPRGVIVIMGAGGMGLAIARRICPGRLLLLADYSEEALHKAKSQLDEEGQHNVQTHRVDCSDTSAVKAFAAAAHSAGRVEAVVHTAGVSPVMASVDKVFAIDLLGTALVIEAFQPVLAEGGSMVCVASIAGHMLASPFSPATEQHFATASTARLLEHEIVKGAIEGKQPALAYQIAKRANVLRVQAASLSFGRRGCRINSISPGVIHTAMIFRELATPGASMVRQVAESASMGRYGTAADIANVVAFLLSPESSFVTGADLLVDGGVVAGQRWGAEEGRADIESYDRM